MQAGKFARIQAAGSEGLDCLETNAGVRIEEAGDHNVVDPTQEGRMDAVMWKINYIRCLR